MPQEEDIHSESLLDNGLAKVVRGLNDALNDLEPNQGPQLKEALGLVFSGALLLIKERIRRDDAEAIFVPLKPGEQLSPGQRQRTLNYGKCIARLRAIPDFILSSTDETAFNMAQTLRNDIEHYEVHFKVSDLQALLGTLAEFLFTFTRDQLGIRLEDRLGAYAVHRFQDLPRIDQRLEIEFRGRFLLHATAYDDLDDEQLQALYESVEQYDEQQGTGGAIYACRECGTDRIVPIFSDDKGADPERDSGSFGVCTNLECRAVYPFRACIKCGSTATNGDDLCEDCQGDADRHFDD